AIAVAIAVSALTTAIGREVGRFEHLLAIVIVGVVYLVFGLALPRALARRRPGRFAGFVLVAGGALGWLARPLTRLVDALSRGFGQLLPPEADDAAPAGTEDELRGIVIEGPDDGVIEPEEREMIDNVLQLEDTAARDIMVPRVDVVAVDETADPTTILDAITRAGHSRIPVYRDDIDHIVGILHAKDLLRFVGRNANHLPIAEFLRPAHVVPESKRIDDLLHEFQRGRVHIAIVVDEYGGTAGLVTIEDILEEIVGEIQDEYDSELPLFEWLGDGAILADGRLPLEDVEDALHIKLDIDEGSVAGFVHRHLERLPEVGDAFEADGLRVEILEVEGHRLRRLRIALAGGEPASDDEAGVSGPDPSPNGSADNA
ncbi:MAG TPA: hemolysin family protein, partial [Thermomicrobiales bacterium]|nr:hemolysin family protein [Thermomicrobiales bacterium]